ncbi:MCE family protein [Actinocorallia lasiicapitis]
MLKKLSSWAFVAIVAVLVVAGGVMILPSPPGTKVTAYFTATIGVYPGSDVRVLGVRVGRIESITPEGQRVKVVLDVDHGVDLPAEPKAAVVTPSIVSDRYIQLVPAYSDGPKMAPGHVIEEKDTRTPIELDQIYEGLQSLAQELGPNGINKNGALSEAIKVGAKNLNGNGQDLRTVIEEFSKASKTLADSKGDLFATVDNLQKFVAMLKKNDSSIRAAENKLAVVAKFLADDRAEIGASLDQLSDALVKVKGFITDNRELIRSNVDKLADITGVLVKQRKALATTLDVLPLDADNLLRAYNPATRTLSARGNLLELQKGMGSFANKTAAGGACPTEGPASPACQRKASLKPVSQNQAAGLPPMALPAIGFVYGAGAGL